MDELPSRALAVLRLAQPLDECRDPAARARVHAAVLATVLPATAQAADAGPGVSAPVRLLSGLRAKLLIASTVVAVVGASVALRRTQPPAAPAPAPTRSAAPSLAQPNVLASPPEAPTAAAAEAPPAKREAKPRRAATPDRLDAELSLLREVDQAVTRGDAPLATRLLAQHRARFPDSVLAVERAGLVVLVKCLEDAPDAARAARAFLAQNPRSVIAPRIERACLAGRP